MKANIKNTKIATTLPQIKRDNRLFEQLLFSVWIEKHFV